MRILKSRLAEISGWGTGIAILYSMFNKEVPWNERATLTLDWILSVSAGTFFCLSLLDFFLEDSKLKENPKNHQPADNSKCY